MLTKWFICLPAKSKGYFRDWQYAHTDYNGKLLTDARPSFTKQSALATHYDTKEEAEKEISDIINNVVSEINSWTSKKDLVIKYRDKWESIYINDKYDIAHELQLRIRDIVHNYPVSVNPRYKSAEVDKGLEHSIDWVKEIELKDKWIELWNNRLKLAKTLIASEQNLEIKFMDREKRKISWSIRSEEDTSDSYCNICGGAVPSIPQLMIKGKHYRETTIICAICMGILAEEAKIQVGKVPDEIMEQYHTDRFLRNLS